MELENNKTIRGFISNEEVVDILGFVDGIGHAIKTEYHHMVEIGKELKGNSHMYDISRTPLTKSITKRQSGDDVLENNLPEIFHSLIGRISESVDIPVENSYLQIIDMERGGRIKAHYDIGVEGYVNYKCNISVLSEDYRLNVGDDHFDIGQGDLYAFEASLYRHWTEKEFDSRRVLLSYGFLVPYERLGRTKDDPRVRLSRRIEKYLL